MGVLISSTTAEATSEPFGVEPGTIKGLMAVGLAGDEAVQIQIKNSDGVWRSAGADQTMTVDNPTRTIHAQTRQPIYRVYKPVTAGAVFVDSI